MRKSRLAMGLLSVGSVVAATIVQPAVADVPPPARVVSNYETATSLELHRDCGYSAPLPSDPSQSLWIFCDTLQTKTVDGEDVPYPEALPFWPGTFAAVGPSTPGQVPTGLSHLPTPGASPLPLPSDRGPALFLPNPTDLKAPDGETPCTERPTGNSDEDYVGYGVTWALGMTQGPASPVTMSVDGTALTITDASSLLFVTYMQVCVTSDPDEPFGLDMRPKRWGIAAYDPATNTIVANSIVHSVASPGSKLPWAQALFHPIFRDGYMYAYGYVCDELVPAFGACAQGRVGTARAQLASLSDSSTYEYQTPNGWTADASQAGDVLPPTASLGTLAMNVADFTSLGQGYLMMEQLTFGGHYRLWSSQSPTGPWVLETTDAMPGCPMQTNVGCYHLWGHPELSSPTSLVYSFYDMQEGFVTLESLDPPV